MAYKRKDHFYKKAKQEGKASRAVYKLDELQDKFKLVKRGDAVLDLGCAPGGWMQELSKMVGPKGRVIGIDLLPLNIEPPQNCSFIQGNLEDEHPTTKIQIMAKGRVDVVVSDMSPNISGIDFADAYRSYEVAMLALEICRKLLKEGGNFVVKIFPGQEFEEYVRILKIHFKKVSTITPEATRKTSSERYLVALNFSG